MIPTRAVQPAQSQKTEIDLTAYLTGGAKEHTAVNSYRRYYSEFINLLAQERICVIVGDFETASFDPSEKIVRLPDFSFSQEILAKMFSVHECAHALHTDPYSESEFQSKLLAACINVVEDRRIETLIKTKYPGFVSIFEHSYDVMHKMGFFGDIKSPDYTQNLLNIINYKCKTGSLSHITLDSRQDAIYNFVRKDLVTFDDTIRKAIFLTKLCQLPYDELTMDQISKAMQEVQGASDDEMAAWAGNTADSDVMTKVVNGYKNEADALRKTSRFSGKTISRQSGDEQLVIRETANFSQLRKLFMENAKK